MDDLTEVDLVVGLNEFGDITMVFNELLVKNGKSSMTFDLDNAVWLVRALTLCIEKAKQEATRQVEH